MESFEKNPLASTVVAVVGDVMLDTFMYGNVTRISPEAPVPVVSITRETNTFGGGANAVANLAALGVKPIMIGRVNHDDDARKELFRQAFAAKISTDYMIASDLPTIRKVRVLGQNQHLVRIDHEVIEPLSAQERKDLEKQLKAARKLTDTVIVSDYGKGMVDQQVFDLIKDIWQGGNVLVDPKPRDGMNYSGATCMTPNLLESSKLLGHEKPAQGDAEAEAVARAMYDTFKLKYALLTRAADGMTLFDGKKATHHKPVHTLQVRDVSGAGDTVISTLAAGLAAKLPIEDTLLLANTAAGIVVSKPGTATVTWPEIVTELKKFADLPPYMFR